MFVNPIEFSLATKANGEQNRANGLEISTPTANTTVNYTQADFAGLQPFPVAADIDVRQGATGGIFITQNGLATNVANVFVNDASQNKVRVTNFVSADVTIDDAQTSADIILKNTQRGIINAEVAGNARVVVEAAQQVDDGFNTTTINTGSGNDTVLLTANDSFVNFTVNTGAGNDVVEASITAQTIANLGDGEDSFIGSNKADIVNGGDNDDLLDGNGGNDVLKGGSGNDRIFADSGNDVLEGGSGNDTMDGGSNDDQVYGDGGNDTLNGGSGNDVLFGDAGNDKLYGGAGNDSLFGGNNGDFITGNAGNDVIDGGAGSDRVYGNEDNDIVIFDNADSAISGGQGYDILDVNGAGKIDFSKIDVQVDGVKQIREFEMLDLTNGSNNEVLLTADQVLQSSDTPFDGVAELFVQGDAGDKITATGDFTVRGADTTVDGITYASFTDTGVTLYVELGLQLNGSSVI